MISTPLFNPNRFVLHTDDISGVMRVNMMGTINLPGVHTFSTYQAPIPVQRPIIYSDSFVCDTINPANTTPNLSDEVYN
jgi:hypothetical protein